ncbi:MAG: ankyrin repeat domain-containing protein [Gammaproteobacteria bacterium]|nr:ankyrin repeat domain-containing protein [Gammaproteobacteria bacterium]
MHFQHEFSILEQLPVDILMLILDKISARDIGHLLLSSNQLQQLTSNKGLWKKRLQLYYPEEHTKLSYQEKQGQVLAEDIYYQQFKSSYVKSYYRTHEENTIVKKSDARWGVYHELYLSIKEDKFDFASFIKENASIFSQTTLLELLLDTNIKNYQQKCVLNWALTPAQPLLNAAFEETKNIEGPEQIAKLQLLLCSHDYEPADPANFELILAVILNQQEQFPPLLYKTKDPNINQPLTKNGFTALFIAARNGYLSQVKYLIANGADMNLFSKNNLSVLHAAAQNGHLDCVKFLHEKGVDINTSAKNAITPLCLAVENGHLECVKFLHEKGAPINIHSNGATPLIRALQKEKWEMGKLLIGMGADVNLNSGNDETPSTPLYVAARSGRLDIVKLLINKGANFQNAAVIHGALNSGLRSGQLDVVKFLIEKGANINITVKVNNYTLLHSAVNDSLEMVKYLVENGADINAVVPGRGTPLDHTTHRDVADYLQHVAPQVYKTIKELKSLLEKKHLLNAHPLDKAIALFEWYADQKFYKKDFTHKKVARHIWIKLNQFKDSNNNTIFTQEAFTKIISDAFKEMYAGSKESSFWIKPNEEMRSDSPFKLVEKLIRKGLASDSEIDEHHNLMQFPANLKTPF